MPDALLEFKGCWVVLIDILGFSERLSNPKTRDSLAVAYREVIDEFPLLSNVVAAHHTKIGANTGWVDLRPLPGTSPSSPSVADLERDPNQVDWKAREVEVNLEWK